MVQYPHVIWALKPNIVIVGSFSESQFDQNYTEAQKYAVIHAEENKGLYSKILLD